MDGWNDFWMFCFLPAAQGVWYDRHGRRVQPKAPAQVAGLEPSGYAPVTREPPPGQNWNPSYIGSASCRGNERLKKKEERHC